MKYINKYIDGFFSFLLFLAIFLDLYFIPDNRQIEIICLGTSLYILYYMWIKKGSTNQWMLFNVIMSNYMILRVIDNLF